MPTYEYRCTSCGHRFDVFQRLDDSSLTICERCGGALRKVFHPAGIVFKGSGFYATDSRAKATGTSSDGDKKNKKKDSKESKDSKADAKPAEKKAAGSGT